MDCRTCVEGWRELEYTGLPDCGACTRPSLLPTNAAAWEVIQATGAALVDGWGGIRLDNARLAAAALGYEWDAELLGKVGAYAACQLEKDEGGGDGEEE